jgi:multidrug efflux pump subunit AcrA (membrane-fusion protein)
MKWKSLTFGTLVVAGIGIAYLQSMAGSQPPKNDSKTPPTAPALQQLSATVKVKVDRQKLVEAGLTPTDVYATIDSFYKEHGRFKLVELQNAPIASVNGKTYLLKDVATIDVDFENQAAALSGPSAKLIYDSKGRPGLSVTGAVGKALKIEVATAQLVTKPQPLPPQIGTIHFDNESLFCIHARFPGEIVETGQVDEAPDPAKPNAKPKKRSLRFGDRVKQGALLAVIYSRELAQAKAALVDASCSLALSKETLERHRKLFEDGSIGLAQLKQSERQVQADSASVLTAERALLTMKLSEREVQELKDEAKKISELAKDKQFKRDAKAEAEKWGRVEIRVPRFDKDHPEKELSIVEKNSCSFDLVEAGKSPTLLKLADLTRLQIWVRLAEEYLPIIRKMLQSPEPGGPLWTIGIPANPDDKLAPMKFTQITPSLGEPYQGAPLLMGYLDNPKGTKYVVGQVVSVTILAPPEPDVVAVPTAALYETGGQTLVFVQPDSTKHEYVLRGVAVAQRFKDVAWVRARLTANDKDKQSARPIELLSAGDRVVIQGNVEMMAALEGLRTNEGK